jgi:hypothetical protein
MGQQARDAFTLSFPSAISAVTQFRGVDFNGVQITVAGAKCAGIAKRSAAIGQPFEAVTLGTAICEAGAAITVGQPLAMDASGRVVPASSLTAAAPGLGTLAIAAGGVAVTSAAANGTSDLTGALTAGALSGGVLPQWVMGDALEAATGAGAFIEVLLSR